MSLSLGILLTVFRVLVIPAQFEDTAFSCTQSQLEERVLATQEYFNAQFAGRKEFRFELAPVVTLSNPMSYYGANYSDRRDVLLHEAVREACQLTRGDVTFSDYANEKPTELDNLCLIFAGMSEGDGAGSDCIWPQTASLKDNGGTLSISGVAIDSYSVCTELVSDNGENPRFAGPGTLCHEFAHYLGLSDLYDTDGEGSGGRSDALYNTALMDEGFARSDGFCPPGFNAIDLEILGLGQALTLTTGPGSLSPIDLSHSYFKIANPGEAGEFFLIECRRPTGQTGQAGQPSQSGQGTPSDGSGLVIYHVDMSGNDAGYSDYYRRRLTAAERWEYNQVNCNPAWQCAYPVSVSTAEDGSAAGIFLPSPTLDAFGQDGSASFTFRSGYRSPIVLRDIRIQSDGTVSFNAIEPVTIMRTIPYQDAATVSWSIDESLVHESTFTVRWRAEGEEPASIDLPEGTRSYTISSLKPGTTYNIEVSLHIDDVSYTATASTTTRYRNDSTSPFIYLRTKEGMRNNDGSFVYGARIPLQVFNVSKPYRIRWFFDGRAVTEEADGMFTLTGSGTLKAVLEFEDSRRLTIIKEIEIR